MRDATPVDAVVAIASKGDPGLIEIEGRTGLHFPRDAEGRYAGHYPKSSEEAVAHVESLIEGGAQFLCLPATASWWLEHYQGLAAWLDSHCRVAARDPGTCLVYDLLAAPGEATAAAEVDAAVAQLRSLLDALLPEEASLLVAGTAVDGLSAPGRSVAPLGAGEPATLQRLETARAEHPFFVLVAKDALAPPLDPALEGFLERHAEPVARRAHLCDLFRIEAARSESAGAVPSRLGEGEGGPSSDPTLQGETAKTLSERLERLGLAGEDSSGAPIPPISEGRT
ncbi:MAG TPA: hypothetical protein VFS48_01505 [Solirubrobacterales bacterium]|nr:hypothetical protein [Solirubrobacterales bacterium]